MTISCNAVVLFALFAVCCVSARDKIAGYEPDSDVKEHSEIDLDQRDMENFCDEGDWSEAKGIYSSGKHSDKSDSKRTLRGFSTDSNKLQGEPFYELYKRYWGSDTYADDFVIAALDAKRGNTRDNDFTGAKDDMRSECANKGSQYQNVHMYVIHEMEDAINDCYEGDLENNDKGVKAWDEAWAFWVGSIVNEDGSNALDGKLGYTLAHKRSTDYGTKVDGTARVNRKMLELFEEGREELGRRDCQDVINIKNRIVRQMNIPLIQGVIRYVQQTKDEQVDPDNIDEKNLDKTHAEGWAFSAAVLPFIDHCDPTSAKVLVDNFKPKASPPMSAEKNDVFAALQRTYGCLGIACDEVYTSEVDFNCQTSGSIKAVEGEDKSSKGESGNRSSGLSGGAIAGIVIACLVVVAVVAFVVLRRRGKKGADLPVAGDGAIAAEA